MGSIADKLSKLMETKSAIKSAIAAKGVTVSDSDPFSSYAGKIAQIEGGGGGGGDQAVTLEFPFFTVIPKDFRFYSAGTPIKLIFRDATEIENGALTSCEDLVAVDLENVALIGLQVFVFCAQLEILIVRTSQVCTLSALGLGFTAIANGNGYIYVPKNLVDDYKIATNWTKYADQIRAIEDYPEVTGGMI